MLQAIGEPYSINLIRHDIREDSNLHCRILIQSEINLKAEWLGIQFEWQDVLEKGPESTWGD
jgi:hypothetical protein